MTIPNYSFGSANILSHSELNVITVPADGSEITVAFLDSEPVGRPVHHVRRRANSNAGTPMACRGEDCILCSHSAPGGDIDTLTHRIAVWGAQVSNATEYWETEGAEPLFQAGVINLTAAAFNSLCRKADEEGGPEHLVGRAIVLHRDISETDFQPVLVEVTDEMLDVSGIMDTPPNRDAIRNSLAVEWNGTETWFNRLIPKNAPDADGAGDGE